jgi:hypothetical protein
MAKLTAAARKKIPTSSFAIKGRAKTAAGKAKSGSYPIPDASHARNALSRVSQFGSSSEKAQVRAAVKSKFPNIGKNGAKNGAKKGK